jgi:hypothetical protein
MSGYAHVRNRSIRDRVRRAASLAMSATPRKRTSVQSLRDRSLRTCRTGREVLAADRRKVARCSADGVPSLRGSERLHLWRSAGQHALGRGALIRGLELGGPFLRFCVGYPVSAALSLGVAGSCLARPGLISVIRSLLRPDSCGECRQTDHT